MRCPILIGRERQLEQLRRALTEAATRRGAWIGIIGEAGVGKTRLVDEFARAVSTAGVRAVVGRASSVDRSSPFRPLVEVLIAATAGIDRPDQHSTVAPYAAVVDRFVPHWGGGHEDSRSDSPAITGESILQVLSWVAGDAALVVVLEDLHWADPATLSVCDYLVDHLDDKPLLVLASARHGETPLALADVLRRSETIELASLDPDDARAMATACISGPDDALIDRILAAAEGLPLLSRTWSVTTAGSTHSPARGSNRSALTRSGRWPPLRSSVSASRSTLSPWQLAKLTRTLPPHSMPGPPLSSSLAPQKALPSATR